jgi:hypothetical protein
MSKRFWDILKTSIYVAIISVTVTSFRYGCWHRTNKACHEQCKVQGYAAGEDEFLYEHTVCACFSSKPGPTHRFVLQVSELLED